MSGNMNEMKKEMSQLEAEYSEYINKNGFNYAEYLKPAPGSFMEKYRTRMDELAKAIGVKELEYWKG